jgi:sulfoxide reductase heme-binding subunit YedZ
MIRWLKPIVFLACLAPLARLAWKAYSGNLGANPIEVITHSTGDWTLIFLLVTLSVMPLRKGQANSGRFASGACLVCSHFST